MLKFTKRLPIELTDGSVHEVRTLSITATEEFRATYNLLIKEIEDEAYKTLNIIQAFQSRPLFKKYVTNLLNIVGLDFDRVPSDSLYDLLYPHQTEDGGYERQGLLIKFALGEIKEGSKVSKETVDAYAQALAQLWHVGQSFEDAVNVLGTLGYEDLNAVLAERAELAKSPEEKMQERAKARAIEAQQKLAESLGKGQKVELGNEVDINSLF